MKVLLLSCSTGEGHNHCAQAVREALDKRGHQTEFLDMLRLFGEPGPLNIESALNAISSRAPELFGVMYRAGAMYSATNVTSPVYLANIRHAKQLRDLIEARGYDAVVCSHLFPMETLTYIRKHYTLRAKCYGVLSDYTCIPFLTETALDLYMVPHREVLEECVKNGIDREKLAATGMPVSAQFCGEIEKRAAREALSLPPDQRIYLIMTGGIGCGDAVTLCKTILKLPSDDALLLVLVGRNEELKTAAQTAFQGQENVRAVPFTDKVALYMRAADALLSKAGGISSSEAAALRVPLVHTMAIPGVETLNAQFFARHGMSFFASSPDEAARCADRLIFDPKTADQMLKAQRENVPTDGADRIAALVEAGGA